MKESMMVSKTYTRELRRARRLKYAGSVVDFEALARDLAAAR